MRTPIETVDEAVEQTLDWVSYGEPNSTDLIDVAASSYPVMGKDGGFTGNDERVKSRTEFIRETDDSECIVEITSPDGPVELTIDGETVSYDTHEAGIRAFYEWASA